MIKKFIIPLVLLLTVSLGVIDIEAGFTHSKIVNGDAGIEFLAKGSTRLTNYIPFTFQEEILRKLYYGIYLGTGFSQQYTSPRISQFRYNHFGYRWDISAGVVLDNFEFIYTHSTRYEYEGAAPDVLFFNKDVDSITFRWKGEI